MDHPQLAPLLTHLLLTCLVLLSERCGLPSLLRAQRPRCGLPSLLRAQRPFGSKDSPLASARIAQVFPLLQPVSRESRLHGASLLGRLPRGGAVGVIGAASRRSQSRDHDHVSRITGIPQVRSPEFPTLGAAGKRWPEGRDGVAVAAHAVAVAGDGEDGGVV